MPGSLLIVSAPSGGGKTSLTRALVRQAAAAGQSVRISVSYTTRQARPGEQDGVHYHFVSDAEFERMAQADAFLEHARVFGRRYGTGRSVTESLLASGTDVLLDIDWQGAQQIRAAMPDAIGVFILPPSLPELERRLRDRAQDDAQTIAARMQQARAETAHWHEYDYLIVNRDFDQALSELNAILTAAGRRRTLQQQSHKALLAELTDAVLDGAG
ncbi:MAG: guanylate kinase [Panacagrimonas sp.]